MSPDENICPNGTWEDPVPEIVDSLMKLALEEDMKEPKRKAYSVYYWTCMNPKHRHKTKEIALACIAEAERPKRELFRWTPESLAEALGMRREGKTYREIGEHYGGLSSSRIQQVINKGERREREQMGFGWRDTEKYEAWKRERGYP